MPAAERIQPADAPHNHPLVHLAVMAAAHKEQGPFRHPGPGFDLDASRKRQTRSVKEIPRVLNLRVFLIALHH
jgi:hypothetical protein